MYEAELRQEWYEAGRPTGSYDKWLRTLPLYEEGYSGDQGEPLDAKMDSNAVTHRDVRT